MADGDSKRILVVDDDMSLARLISEALRTRFQCEVDATPNPEYAFELALKLTWVADSGRTAAPIELRAFFVERAGGEGTP